MKKERDTERMGGGEQREKERKCCVCIIKVYATNIF